MDGGVSVLYGYEDIYVPCLLSTFLIWNGPNIQDNLSETMCVTRATVGQFQEAVLN